MLLWEFVTPQEGLKWSMKENPFRLPSLYTAWIHLQGIPVITPDL